MYSAPDSSSTLPTRGLLLVMTGASGVGKGTLREKWLDGQDVFYSTSWTTREPRIHEQNGREYIFVSEAEFAAKAKVGGFLEYAQFVGNYYGTPIEPIETALARGQDVILEIEVEGAMQVKERMGEQAILIFIMPPSLSELRNRLMGRATETPERIEKRLLRARDEIKAVHDFRYVIINDDLEQATEQLLRIQAAERLQMRSNEILSPEDLTLQQSVQNLRSQAFSTEELEYIASH